MINIIKFGYYTGRGFKNQLVLCEGAIYSSVNDARKNLKLKNKTYNTITCHRGSIASTRHTIEVLKSNGYENLLGSFGLPKG